MWGIGSGAPVATDSCKAIEKNELTLTCLKWNINNYAEAHCSIQSLRRNTSLRDLHVIGPLTDLQVSELCSALAENRHVSRLWLELSECSGKGLDHVGCLVAHSSSLKGLYLSLNNVTEEGAVKLSRHLGNSYLTSFSIYGSQLDLHDLCIGNKGVAALANAISSSPYLRELTFGHCALSVSGLPDVLTAVNNCASLKSCCLYANQLGGAAAGVVIGQFLAGNVSLQELLLDENQDVCVAEVCRGLCSNKCLTSLSLGSCGITAEQGQWVGSMLAQNGCLERLNLRGNPLIKEAIELISRGLMQNQSLRQLSLSNCGVTDAGCGHLANTLRVQRTLKQLELSCNNIGDGGAIALATTLHSNKSLDTLLLDGNRVGEPGRAAMATALEHNITMTTLQLGERISESLFRTSLLGTLLAKNSKIASLQQKLVQLEAENKQLTQINCELQKKLNN